MNNLNHFIKSSIGKKQIVAITGLMLIGFVITHLAGNLLIFLGPDVFNQYAQKLQNLRPGLYLIEAFLLYIFVVHLWFTALIVYDNIKARPIPYTVNKSSPQRSLATRLMPYTGMAILAFVIWHLLDFTFIDQHGLRSVLSDGKSYGIYGIVYNSFKDPLHSTLYIAAMLALGFHLSHALQSTIQTLGFLNPKYADNIKKFSNALGFFVAVAYSSIPIYILFSGKY